MPCLLLSCAIFFPSLFLFLLDFPSSFFLSSSTSSISLYSFIPLHLFFLIFPLFSSHLISSPLSLTFFVCLSTFLFFNLSVRPFFFDIHICIFIRICTKPPNSRSYNASPPSPPFSIAHCSHTSNLYHFSTFVQQDKSYVPAGLFVL